MIQERGRMRLDVAKNLGSPRGRAVGDLCFARLFGLVGSRGIAAAQNPRVNRMMERPGRSQ
jgi:hypothetical protein